MKILYIDHYAGSPDMGMEYRPYYLSREWIKMGHKVSVIAGDYSHLRRNNPIVEKDMEKQTIDGMDYYWLRTGSYSGNGIKRAFSMIRFCCKLNKQIRWISTHLKPDVVISSSTYPIDSIPAHKICKAARESGIDSKHIHEVHDMWPATLTELGGMSKFNPFVMLMQFGENYAYSHADEIVSLLPYAEGYMKEHGLKQGHFHHIPNGIVIDEWDNPEPIPLEHSEVLVRVRESGKFVVGYFGGFALSNSVSTLLDTARELLPYQDSIHFVLVGDGVQKGELIQSAQSNRLNNVTFLPPVKKESIPLLAKRFDCVFMAAIDSPLYRFGVCMNKIFDYMMSGLPVVLSINTPSTPVEQCGCGVMVKANDASKLANTILRIYNMDSEDRNNMGKLGRQEILDHYTYEILAKEFMNVILANNRQSLQ